MNNQHIKKISEELSIVERQVSAVVELLMQDATVPFIARYRKEATGSLDEVAITDIRNKLTQLQELKARKETIVRSLEKQGVLDEELTFKIDQSQTLVELEDLYLPFKPKRRTRATIAKEKGLEPLAMLIFEQTGSPVIQAAQTFINPEKSVNTIEDALGGARDILAEMINETPRARSELRHLFMEKGVISSTVVVGKEDEGKKFKDYFNWQEPVKTAPSHRILAMRRGEKENILNFTIAPPEDQSISILNALFIKGKGDDSAQVELSVKDSYKRLLSRSMETETRLALKEKADKDAIFVFSENLRQLLLSPPLGAKRVLGIDPGFRTGCKMVCLDRQGKLLHHDTIYPNMNEKNDRDAEQKLLFLVEKFDIEAIAIGNGTGGRETETFVKKIPFNKKISVIVVNESGASIYSASDVAREEFPDLDLTIRGSVSIGRRLMDPLSELVKIDPKSIGVGQYQHDVDQNDLKQALDDSVIHCVNAVGVDINRASAQLLTYVSGLGPVLAKNIVHHRDENGPFKNRKQLTKVPRLGPKAFEQCAGFLRIPDGQVALDRSAVHPESYHIVDLMAKDLQCSIDDLMAQKSLRDNINISVYVTEKTGIPTLNDIVAELAKPGRDPRKEFQEFSFATGIEKISDLEPGMKIPGIVTNVTAFGAFVDVGVHQDGLVHISELSDSFVKDPASIVKVNQKVDVRVLEVDIDRKRISLSMKSTVEKRDGTHQTSPATRKPAPKKITERPGKKNEAKPSPFNNPFAKLLNKDS
ncbi:MAG: RNA-binding transcriptional accessory protein [Proteobacteria bacterium]|nr:RNA-binding transcriptional accessory protein [Pseudomonadota bacterium]